MINIFCFQNFGFIVFDSHIPVQNILQQKVILHCYSINSESNFNFNAYKFLPNPIQT